MQILQPTTLIPYSEGLRMQESLLAEIASGRAPESLLLLEHEPVYTIGRTRDQSSLGPPGGLPHPVFETNRGGQATYHGPGQITGYPLLDLARRGKDLHAHLRRIEDALIASCAVFGVRAGRRDGLTGVWCGDRKLASIGVGVRKWVSMHGFAINISGESLPPFLAITPCGLSEVRMTCLEAEAGRAITVSEAKEVIGRNLRTVFLLPAEACRNLSDA